jgi:predicted lipoprotein with Yx(FWY)xxD motif
MRKAFPLIATAALGALVAFTGCGGAYGGGGTTTTSTQATTTAAPSGGAVVSVTSVPKLGRVLVNSEGLTLYDFHKDKAGKSACYGQCASVWPPLLTGSDPQPSNGATASKLGTTKRKDGTLQVTYAGHPLYLYTADAKPGDANGNDIDSFGAQWYALQPSGEEAGD